jgi:hypothetical protein
MGLFLNNSYNFVSIGDFIDLYYFILKKGLKYFIKKLRINNNDRITSKWDIVNNEVSFWNLEIVNNRWIYCCF